MSIAVLFVCPVCKLSLRILPERFPVHCRCGYTQLLPTADLAKIQPVEECQCRGDEDLGINNTFFCKYHQLRKTQHYRELCQNKPAYREAWNKGGGPGRSTPHDPNAPIPTSKPPMPPGPGTELSKMLGCGGCKFAKEMNELGSDECEKQIDRFIRQLVKPKTKGGQQRMGRKAARRMITMAINRAKIIMQGQINNA